MGRYYRIEVTAPSGSATTGSGAPVAFGSQDASTVTTGVSSLFPLDSTGNPSAYEVDFDLSLTSNGSLGSGNRLLTVKGIDPKIISQIRNLNLSNITIYGGFDKGMPLSNLMAPKSVQPILQGVIFGPWGNWVGTELYVCLPIISTVGAPQTNPNLVLNGVPGQKLSDAIQNSLAVAFPSLQVVIDISDNLTFVQDMQGVHGSLEDFIKQLSSFSISQLHNQYPNYQGIKAGWKGSTFLVSDKVTPSGSKTVEITAAELLGNPVWVDSITMQVMCPMRSDIQLLDQVTLPATPQIISGPQAVNLSNQQFTGTYQAIEIRHVGNSRSADGLAWATVLTLIAQPVTSTNQNSAIGSSIATTGSGAPVAFGT